MADRKRLRKHVESSRRAETAYAEPAPAMAGLPEDIAPDSHLPDVDVFGQELVRECPHCGTGVQLDVDLCPICGAKLGAPDAGLVGLFDGMEFSDDDREIHCPLCGEYVALGDDTCPACNEPLRDCEQRKDSPLLDPVVHDRNVVLVRLDVESGELSYLQKAVENGTLDQVTVHVSAEEEDPGPRGRKRGESG